MTNQSNGKSTPPTKATAKASTATAPAAAKGTQTAAQTAQLQPSKAPNQPKPASAKTQTNPKQAPAQKKAPPSADTGVNPTSTATAAISATKPRPIKPLPTQNHATKLTLYCRLMRLDKPIGILLLLWPTLWSLWLAAKGVPSLKNLLIFSLGVVLMRSAGCVINDYADRHIDGNVQRTQHRPLATGAVSSREALVLFAVLCLLAFGLVLLTDPLTIALSVGGLLLAATYPFMKRHTHLPQLVLGAAFAWGIPMGFAAEAGHLTRDMWLIYLAVVVWTLVYDTFYAMVDRDDDIKIGVKSTAILFGEQDRLITAALQIMVIYSLVLIGQRFQLQIYYYLGVSAAAALFAYQQWLIRFRERTACFTAFLNNNWVGAVVFAGIAADLALK